MFDEEFLYIQPFYISLICVFSGDSGYDRVRPLSYSDADLVIICFSVGDPDSMENVVSKVITVKIQIKNILVESRSKSNFLPCLIVASF